MKALVLTAYNELNLKEVPEPEIGDHDVLLRVSACGICGSDVHGWDGSTGRRQPPIIMGHEASGVVERVGSLVTSVRVGDRVAPDSTLYDASSYFSQKGLTNLCDSRRVLGVSCDEYSQQGAFAELVAVPAHVLYRLPEGLSFEQAALLEPLSIAAHALRLTPVEDGDTALVVGAGLIGSMMIQVLRQSAVRSIVAVDVDPAKLQLARELGADVTLNARDQDVPAELRKISAGRGADIVFEAVGTEATLQQAIASVRKGGTVTLIGNLAPQATVPLQQLVTRQIRLQGSCASAGEYPQCLDWVRAGAVNVDRFISARATLEQGADFFQRLYRRQPGLIKVVLEPNG